MTEDNRETKQSRRNGAFNLYYYITLAALAIVVVFHWIFGGKYGLFGTVALWSACVFIALGFLNAIGLFGRH